MATNFPTTIDTFTDPTGTQAMNATSPTHSGIHTNANDAIAALEAKVGVNSSAVTTSLDYRLAAVGNNVVSRTSTGTLGVGESTVFSGSTASQTLTLTAAPAINCTNVVTNIASVSVTIAAGAGGTINTNGTVGSIVLPPGASVTLAYLSTVWYVTESLPYQQTQAKTYNDLLSYTFDPTLVVLTGQALASAAVIYVTRMPLPPYSISITNVLCYLQALSSSTLTNAFAGVYNSAGTLIGSSADQHTAWASGGGGVGLNTLALAGGPFTVTPLGSNDFLWGALYCGATGGTLPAFHKALGATATLLNAGTTAARTRVGSIAQASGVLANIVPGSLAQAVNPFWMAIS